MWERSRGETVFLISLAFLVFKKIPYRGEAHVKRYRERSDNRRHCSNLWIGLWICKLHSSDIRFLHFQLDSCGRLFGIGRIVVWADRKCGMAALAIFDWLYSSHFANPHPTYESDWMEIASAALTTCAADVIG